MDQEQISRYWRNFRAWFWSIFAYYCALSVILLTLFSIGNYRLGIFFTWLGISEDTIWFVSIILSILPAIFLAVILSLYSYRLTGKITYLLLILVFPLFLIFPIGPLLFLVVSYQFIKTLKNKALSKF